MTRRTRRIELTTAEIDAIRKVIDHRMGGSTSWDAEMIRLRHLVSVFKNAEEVVVVIVDEG